MIGAGQRVCTAIPSLAGQGIHEEIKQLSLRRDIQLRVGVLSMQFDRLRRYAQFVGYEPRAVAKQHQLDHLLLAAREYR